MILLRLTLQVLPVKLEYMYVSLKLNFEVIDENTLDANCEDIRVCANNFSSFHISSSLFRPSLFCTIFK